MSSSSARTRVAPIGRDEKRGPAGHPAVMRTARIATVRNRDRIEVSSFRTCQTGRTGDVAGARRFTRERQTIAAGGGRQWWLVSHGGLFRNGLVLLAAYPH